MFNRIGFNKLLFNKSIPLFKNYDEITLFGELKGFETLNGLIEYNLNLEGIQILDIQQYGNLRYIENLEGEQVLFYNLDGELVPILIGVKVQYIINLIGQVINDG